MPIAGDFCYCVDLNMATHEELQHIIHTGPARAAAIIEGRP